MKRRTFRQIRAAAPAAMHHSVYVVLLDAKAAKLRAVKALNPNATPGMACIYVGLTGLDPSERFANHKAGLKSAPVVRRYGLRLLPELFEHLNPMPYDVAVRMEVELAEDFRAQGYFVTGGH